MATTLRPQTPSSLEKPSEESDISLNANTIKIKDSSPKGSSPKGSSTAHTDDEDIAEPEPEPEPEPPHPGVTTHRKRFKILIDADSNENVYSANEVDDVPPEEVTAEKVEEEEKLPESQSHQSVASSVSCSEKRKKKDVVFYIEHSLSSSSENDNDQDGNKRESYPKIKASRKTLLTIERLTDSDSRNPDEMVSLGLSPPSTSDEDNLHIGWLAYPTGSSKKRVQKTSGRKRQTSWGLPSCIDILKYVASPITKVCQKCRGKGNKVEGTEAIIQSSPASSDINLF